MPSPVALMLLALYSGYALLGSALSLWLLLNAQTWVGRGLAFAGFCRYCPANLIPEIEQVNLGFLLMPYPDPYLTREQARRVSTSTLDLYREMEADPDFRELGSIMGLAYRGLLGLPANAGHYYLYVPHHPTGEPLPALIFLHGAASFFSRR